MGCGICGCHDCRGGLHCHYTRAAMQMRMQQQALQGAHYLKALGGIVPQQMAAQQATLQIATMQGSLQAAPLKPISSGGMKVEDLIGWRIWRVKHDYLWSYSADYAWMPGDVSEGDPGDHDSAGIWAFKEKRRAFQKAVESGAGFVWGSVRLWGHVVEHRDGYRAAKARIVSIEGATRDIGPETLLDLCRLYRVPAIDVSALSTRKAAPSPAFIQMPFGEMVPLAEKSPPRLPWPIIGTVTGMLAGLAGLAGFWISHP